jgi:hypothetical protein
MFGVQKKGWWGDKGDRVHIYESLSASNISVRLCMLRITVRAFISLSLTLISICSL